MAGTTRRGLTTVSGWAAGLLTVAWLTALSGWATGLLTVAGRLLAGRLLAGRLLAVASGLRSTRLLAVASGLRSTRLLAVPPGGSRSAAGCSHRFHSFACGRGVAT